MSVATAVVLRVTYESRDAAGKLIPPPEHLARLNMTARHLWELLANVANDDGMSWHSVESIAARVGCTEANVRRATRRLESAGVLTVTVGGGRGHTNLYTVPTCPQPARQRAGSDRETRAVRPTNPRGTAQQTRAVPRDEVPIEVPVEAGPPPPLEPWVLDRYPALALRCGDVT